MCRTVCFLSALYALRAVAACRWAGWQARQPMPADLRCLLLYSATCSALAPHFRAGSAQPEDLASSATAEALFMRLLGQAHSAGQLRALQAMLDQVWGSAYAFDAVPHQPCTEQAAGLLPNEESGESDGHDCQERLSRMPDPGIAGLQSFEPIVPAEQPVKSQNSAPGTPPAEESRWPTTASQPDFADGWDEADQLQHSGEPAFHPASAAHAADGWDLEDNPIALPELSQAALEGAQSAQSVDSKDREKTPCSASHAAVQAADPQAAADGWKAEEGLALPPAAHEDAGPAQGAAAKTHNLHSVDEPALNACPSGWESDTDVCEALEASAADEQAGQCHTPEAPSAPSEVSHAADAGTRAGKRALAPEDMMALSRESCAGNHHSAECLQSSKAVGTTRDGPARGGAVPMHACWAALLQRLLAAGDRQLAGSVLARLEQAQMQQAALVSEAEADALVNASAGAGEDPVKDTIQSGLKAIVTCMSPHNALTIKTMHTRTTWFGKPLWPSSGQTAGT